MNPSNILFRQEFQHRNSIWFCKNVFKAFVLMVNVQRSSCFIGNRPYRLPTEVNTYNLFKKEYHLWNPPMKWKRNLCNKRKLMATTDGKHQSITRESKIETIKLRGREVLVKRDDQLRLDSGISGNKARKLFWLNEIPAEKFPKVVLSHGGHQSNALVALAAICAKNRPNTEFRYYTKKVPRWLRKNPSGNFARALALGTQIMELSNEEYEEVFGGPSGKLTAPSCLDTSEESTIYVPQGGAVPMAETGIRLLASEILAHIEEECLNSDDLVVVTPSGTGTTALFLAKHLQPEGVQVVTVPCIGDGEYLFRQMSNLQRASTNSSIGNFPYILEGATKHQFGKPDIALLDVWRELEELEFYVDLVYAPRVWQVLFENWEPDNDILGDKTILYVHSGGIEGVSTQLTRYKHKGLIDARQIM